MPKSVGFPARFFLICREIVFAAEPEKQLEAVSAQRRGKLALAGSMSRKLLFGAPHPVADIEALCIPFFLRAEIISAHPSRFKAECIAGYLLLAEFLRVVHHLKLVGKILVDECKTVAPFRENHRSASNISKALEYRFQAVAGEEIKIYISVGQKPAYLVFVFIAYIDAVPYRGIAEYAVARFCHKERNDYLGAHIDYSLEVCSAVEHDSVRIAFAETVENFALGLYRDILRVFLEVYIFDSLVLGGIADYLLSLGTEIRELLVEKL